MEALLFYLANSISSGAIGHYVSKGLRQIDERLPDLLEGDPDISKANQIVAENSLEMDIARLSHEVKSKVENINNGNSINVTGGYNDGIIANSVEIKNLKKNVKVNPPNGAISSSLNHRNYSKYLIDRYHEFKKADVGNVKYPIFYNAIKKEFGAKWDMIHLDNFDDLVAFIQTRIDKTILGKNRKSKNVKRYSTFEEYLSNHNGS